MPSFSRKSLSHLDTCHPDLVRLFLAVVAKHDCTVVGGGRLLEEQRENVRRGASTTLKSNHVTDDTTNPRKLAGLSDAVDVVPYPIDWRDRERFIHFSGIVLGYAECMGIPLRLGADWNGNGRFIERFFDAPHFELV